jgi:hypothetical protein
MTSEKVTTSIAPTTDLDKNDLSRLELLNEVKSSGDFFRLFDGQSQVITFDLNAALGTRTRTIRTRDGENQRQITRMSFIIWNHRPITSITYPSSRR